ncbi:MAG: sigma-54-dependent Fis family transcriptional regulator [Deltaproteobacteria bacterium]|nr:sigma-54-dependent Fis family transcriptional regulator [Deltaproteobacteria bacterium]
MTLRPKNPYLDFAKDRARAARLWERFQAGRGGEEGNGGDTYADLLFEEWQRCRDLGVDPRKREGVLLPPEEYARVASERGFLLEKGRQALDRVGDLGVPGILILADEEGTILHIAGDPSVRLRAAGLSNLTEGANWKESHAGTNGIGTALARKAPVHVYSSEHFCDGWHMWTCAGAPIFDPTSRDVLGVVDFTTYDKEYRAESVALSYSLARNITAELGMQFELERIQLLHRYKTYAEQFPSDCVAVFDRMGRVVKISNIMDPSDHWLHSLVGVKQNDSTREVVDICVSGEAHPIGALAVVRRAPPTRLYGVLDSAHDEKTANFGGFVTRHDALKRVMERIGKVAATDLSVLLIGETGTGKELIARYIHNESKRRDGPYVAVNCGATSKELFESTFFGYERGAFTGADSRGRKGLFESANGGTLFLDEIGEMPLAMQAGLLRVLEVGTFRRIGSDREFSTNCRIVAATNKSLLEAVARGTFRSDLYYRLSVAKAEILPLRDRPEDIELLIEHLKKGFCQKQNIALKRFTPDAMRILLEYGWPGNAREVRNVVESSVICSDDPITLDDIPWEIRSAVEVQRGAVVGGDSRLLAEGPRPDYGGSVREHEKWLILSALKKYRKISLVADALGISRSTLYRRLATLGVDVKSVLSDSDHDESH